MVSNFWGSGLVENMMANQGEYRPGHCTGGEFTVIKKNERKLQIDAIYRLQP